tara:strand:+ start:9163 stop:9330 length:168 start_codon:yes stop_codon:yes gene_type:complete
MKKVTEKTETVEEQKQPTKVAYEIETINKVMQYLSSKPYGEVQELFALLQKGDLS